MTLFSKEDIIVVTGASSGIGENVAIQLNQEGATVIAIARNKERLNKMKSKCKNPENVYIEIKDLTENIESLPAYIKELKEKYGKFRGLAYCAGAVEVKPLQMLDLESMKRIFDIDYFAPVFMAKGFADRRNNIGRGASAVFISSASTWLCSRGMTTYSGAKAALASSIKSISRETASSGVRFNCVSPTDVKTPMTQSEHILNTLQDRETRYPLGLGEVDDVANFIIFLLSDKAKWITTQNYLVDCGYM